MDDRGNIHYLPEGTTEKEMKALGVTSILTDDELEYVLDFPVDERNDKLEKYRLKKIERLEAEIRAKERQLKLNRRPVVKRKKVVSAVSSKNGISRNKKKMIKNSKKKNRKRR